MRIAWVIAATIAVVSVTPAQAADAPRADSAAPAASALDLPPHVALRGSFISEARVGLFSRELWGEAGVGTLHTELLFAKPLTASDLFTSYFVPRPHIGSSLDLNGGVGVAFAGLTWNIDMTPQIFVEASLGGALHRQRVKDDPIRAAQAMPGCSPSFRETASVGYRISERLSFMATVERYDNAGLCAERRSLTNIGARIGYSF